MTGRLRFVRVLLLSAGALFAAGCLLTQSLDGYSGGTATADGSTPIDEADATNAADATDPADAQVSGDAIPAFDGSSAPFCSALTFAPTLCTDFDNGSFTPAWSVVDSAGSVELTTNPSASSPNALRSHTDNVASPGGRYVYAFLKHVDTSTFVSTADLSFDWYFDGASFAGVNSNAFSELSLNEEHLYDLQIRVDAAGALTLAEVAGTTHAYLLGTVQTKTWYRVRLVYSRTAKTATVSINDKNVLTAQALVDSAPSANGYEWRLGSNTQAPTNAFDIVIDNAVISIK